MLKITSFFLALVLASNCFALKSVVLKCPNIPQKKSEAEQPKIVNWNVYGTSVTGKYSEIEAIVKAGGEASIICKLENNTVIEHTLPPMGYKTCKLGTQVISTDKSSVAKCNSNNPELCAFSCE